jgi:hypothetical protein
MIGDVFQSSETYLSDGKNAIEEADVGFVVGSSLQLAQNEVEDIA